MAKFLSSALLYLLCVPCVIAQGRFTNPAGVDDVAGSGNRVYTVGSMVQISWTDIISPSYSVLSLGLAVVDQQDIRWLISNKPGLPTTCNWTVTTYDFQYYNSTLFEFLIVNGTIADNTQFGMRFNSPSFGIASQSAQTTSSSSPSSTISSSTKATTATTTITATVSPSATATPNSSSSLSTGAKAGLGVGLPLAFVIALAIAWFVFQSRRKSGANRSRANAPSKSNFGNPSPAYGSGDEGQPLSELETVENRRRTRAELM